MASDGLGWRWMAPFGLRWPRLAPDFLVSGEGRFQFPLFYAFGFLPERGQRYGMVRTYHMFLGMDAVIETG